MAGTTPIGPTSLSPGGIPTPTPREMTGPPLLCRLPKKPQHYPWLSSLAQCLIPDLAEQRKGFAKTQGLHCLCSCLQGILNSLSLVNKMEPWLFTCSLSTRARSFYIQKKKKTIDVMSLKAVYMHIKSVTAHLLTLKLDCSSDCFQERQNVKQFMLVQIESAIFKRSD